MHEAKLKSGFLYFFFFLQGVFLTGMILFVLFENKFVPIVIEKNTQIKTLVNELNKRKHSYPDIEYKNPFYDVISEGNDSCLRGDERVIIWLET